VRGDASACPTWLDFPQTLKAMSPLDRAKELSFRLHKGDLMKAAIAGRRSPAFEAWSILLGSPPPVPNIEQWNSRADSGLSILADAHACFQGIERPCAEDDEGRNILAYIIRPSFFYRYTASMKCVAVRRPVPEGRLYVAHVRLDHPEDFEGGLPRGVFTHGGFVEASPDNLDLPIDHQSRYFERRW
jgi:hypothetical protein